MSRAFKGGTDYYSMERPATESDVLKVIERFIRDNFKKGDEVASEIVREQDKRIILFADEGEQDSPATLSQRDDDLVAYGAVSYRARDHSVQTIWENKFEVREQSDGTLYVRFSDWYGTTVESWSKKVDRDELFV